MDVAQGLVVACCSARLHRLRYCSRNWNQRCLYPLLTLSPLHRPLGQLCFIQRNGWFWESYGWRKYTVWSHRCLVDAKADDVYSLRLRSRIEHFTAWLTCCCSRDVGNSDLTQDMLVTVFCIAFFSTLRIIQEYNSFVRIHYHLFYCVAKLSTMYTGRFYGDRVFIIRCCLITGVV